MHLWRGRRACHKIVLLHIFLFSVCGTPFAQQATNMDTALREAAQYFYGIIPKGSVIAILDFEADNPKDAEQIVHGLTTIMVNDRILVLVDRGRLAQLIETEKNYQMSGRVDEKYEVRIGHELGAHTIISGTVTPTEDGYVVRMQSIDVLLGSLSGDWTRRVKHSDEKRLYLGARGGLSLGFYDNGGGLVDKTVYSSQTLNGTPAYNAALYVSVPIWKLFAMQTEAFITKDTFELLSGNTSLMTVSYTSFMIPLLAKLVYRPSIFTVQGYAGAYLSLPLGQMEVKHRNGSYNADFSLVPGFMGGGGFGVKLGHGYVMADVRYASDFYNVTASYNGNRNVSRRSKMFFALGYEIGLISRK
jgi:hypothetical protein